jgi:hypothetical protein
MEGRWTTISDAARLVSYRVSGKKKKEEESPP